MDTNEPKVAIPGSFRKPVGGARLLYSSDQNEMITVTLYARRNPFPPENVKAVHQRLGATAGRTPISHREE
jgi:hypothetical protein